MPKITMQFKIEPWHRDYELPYKPYYKRGFFSPWVRMGRCNGYQTIDEAFQVIVDFLEADNKIKELLKCQK